MYVNSLAIGGHTEGDFQRLSLSRAELDLFYSNNITFDSNRGSIWSYGLDHPLTNMHGVLGTVFITTMLPDKRMFFQRNFTKFRQVSTFKFFSQKYLKQRENCFFILPKWKNIPQKGDILKKIY